MHRCSCPLQATVRDQLIAAVSPSGSPVMSEGAVGGESREMKHVRMYTTSFVLFPVTICVLRSVPRPGRGWPRTDQVAMLHQCLPCDRMRMYVRTYISIVPHPALLQGTAPSLQEPGAKQQWPDSECLLPPSCAPLLHPAFVPPALAMPCAGPLTVLPLLLSLSLASTDVLERETG